MEFKYKTYEVHAYVLDVYIAFTIFIVGHNF